MIGNIADHAQTKELFPVIRTPRLLLRQLSQEDTQTLHAIWTDPAVLEFMVVDPFETHEETMDMIALLKNLYEAGEGIRWAVTMSHDGTVMGTCGFHNWKKEHFRAETGYELGREYWGNGYMKEALTAILGHGFGNMALNRIEALVTNGNERSLGLLERLGFTKEGLLRNYEWARGKFQDQWVCSILKTNKSPVNI